VLDQKHAIIAVQHHGADPKRHAAGEAPIEMENPPQRRLEALSQILQVHRHPNPEYPDIALDPCVAAAGLSLHSGISQGYHEMIVQRLGPAGNRSGR